MVTNKSINLNTMITIFVQVLYNIFQAGSDVTFLVEYPTLSLILTVGINVGLSIFGVYCHADPKDIAAIKQGLENVMKEYANKVLDDNDLKELADKALYWVKEGMNFWHKIFLNIQERAAAKRKNNVDSNAKN